MEQGGNLRILNPSNPSANPSPAYTVNANTIGSRKRNRIGITIYELLNPSNTGSSILPTYTTNTNRKGLKIVELLNPSAFN